MTPVSSTDAISGIRPVMPQLSPLESAILAQTLSGQGSNTQDIALPPSLRTQIAQLDPDIATLADADVNQILTVAAKELLLTQQLPALELSKPEQMAMDLRRLAGEQIPETEKQAVSTHVQEKLPLAASRAGGQPAPPLYDEILSAARMELPLDQAAPSTGTSARKEAFQAQKYVPSTGSPTPHYVDYGYPVSEEIGTVVPNPAADETISADPEPPLTLQNSQHPTQLPTSELYEFVAHEFLSSYSAPIENNELNNIQYLGQEPVLSQNILDFLAGRSEPSPPSPQSGSKTEQSVPVQVSRYLPTEGYQPVDGALSPVSSPAKFPPPKGHESQAGPPPQIFNPETVLTLKGAGLEQLLMSVNVLERLQGKTPQEQGDVTNLPQVFSTQREHPSLEKQAGAPQSTPLIRPAPDGSTEPSRISKTDIVHAPPPPSPQAGSTPEKSAPVQVSRFLPAEGYQPVDGALSPVFSPTKFPPPKGHEPQADSPPQIFNPETVLTLKGAGLEQLLMSVNVLERLQGKTPQEHGDVTNMPQVFSTQRKHASLEKQAGDPQSTPLIRPASDGSTERPRISKTDIVHALQSQAIGMSSQPLKLDPVELQRTARAAPEAQAGGMREGSAPAHTPVPVALRPGLEGVATTSLLEGSFIIKSSPFSYGHLVVRQEGEHAGRAPDPAKPAPIYVALDVQTPHAGLVKIRLVVAESSAPVASKVGSQGGSGLTGTLTFASRILADEATKKLHELENSLATNAGMRNPSLGVRVETL